MTAEKHVKYWLMIVVLLVAVIAVGINSIRARYDNGQPIEISAPPSQELQGRIYVGGAVSNPGVYPLKAGGSLESIVQAAGGVTAEADLSDLKLYVSPADDENQPQKININRAEAWLLQSLPGIGETRARSIIAYRQQNGVFRNTGELLRVEGIGSATYEQIKPLITVAD